MPPHLAWCVCVCVCARTHAHVSVCMHRCSGVMGWGIHTRQVHRLEDSFMRLVLSLHLSVVPGNKPRSAGLTVQAP